MDAHLLAKPCVMTAVIADNEVTSWEGRGHVMGGSPHRIQEEVASPEGLLVVAPIASE